LQSQFVKFRIRPDLKNRLQAVAKDADTSVSAIVRRAALAIAEGRMLKAANVVDFVAMRLAANELTAAVDATAADPDGAAVRIRAAAVELHRLAKRARPNVRKRKVRPGRFLSKGKEESGPTPRPTGFARRYSVDGRHSWMMA
jgi:predicted transcriptional regulator